MAKRTSTAIFVATLMLVTTLIPLVGGGITESSETTNETFDVDCLRYEITSSTSPYTVEVDKALSGYPSAIVIPSTVTYNGTTYRVTSIGTWAFSDCTSLTSVTIPNSVTSIDTWAFRDCTSLAEIIVENSNTRYYTDNGILFNKDMTELVLCPCGKAGSITIPNSVTSIGTWAFSDCTSLTSVTIPNSVKSIGEYAFRGCSLLTSVTIPDSVTSIGKSIFEHCTLLTEIVVGSGNTKYSSGNGILFDKDKDKLILCPCGKAGSITIPNSVKSIGEYAFRDCTLLTSVTIPDSVTSIGDCAFRDCTAISSVTIPNSVKSIGEYAFCNCTSLTSVTIPNSVTSIGDCAFCGCTAISSVTIPGSVTSIGGGPFASCTSLKKIIVDENNTKYKSVNDVLFNKNMTTLVQYPIGKTETSYVIPDSVTSIGTWAFHECTSLTSVTIPNSVTSIESNAFSICTSLTSVTIPDSVTSIDYYAFSSCTKLKTLNIGACVISHSSISFGPGLESINIDANARGFSGLFYNYEFYMKDGTRLYDESDIAGKHYRAAAGEEGKMIALVECEITYYVDGGSEPAPTQTPLFEGETFIVAGYDGAKDGYTFKGWSDGKDMYQPGRTYTVGDDKVVLIAIWEKNSNGDDGSSLPLWAIVLIIIAAIFLIVALAYYFLLYRKGKNLSDVIGRKKEVQPPSE